MSNLTADMQMRLSARNRKVAVARWTKIIGNEKQRIANTTEAQILKAAICGFLAGDGSVQARKEKSFYRYQLDFFPDDALMLTTYCNALREVYNKIPSVVVRDNVYNVRLTSRTVTEDLLSLARFGVKKWTLPYELFLVPGAKEAWLRAFFSAEAYVGQNHIKIQTTNKEGMECLSKLLGELLINHNCYEYTPKKQNYSLVTIIVIRKKEALIAYDQKIGFFHKKKTDRLKKIVSFIS